MNLVNIGALAEVILALGVIGAGVLQTCGFFFYAGKIDAKVKNLEERVDKVEGHIFGPISHRR